MSPAHLNPAVTVAMAITGNFEWGMVLPYIVAQVLGGFIGGLVVWLAYLPHWNITEDKGAILEPSPLVQLSVTIQPMF